MESRGVGSVERSFVGSIAAHQPEPNFRPVGNIMMQTVVRMNQDLNRRTTVAAGITVIAENGGDCLCIFHILNFFSLCFYNLL